MQNEQNVRIITYFPIILFLQRYRSCQEIHANLSSAPSGYYQIQLSNGLVTEVYCDMEGSNCGGEGGWTRVAYIDMTEPDAMCPQGLVQKSYSGLSLCTYETNTACQMQKTVFSTLGLNYSQVCGRLKGYQAGLVKGFHNYIVSGNTSIDEDYFEGVSITYGSAPRKHIWTYVAGPTEGIESNYLEASCPCSSGSSIASPPFVGSDYYCESGSRYIPDPNQIFINDPLWDGQQCNSNEAACCSTNSTLPWFQKMLNTSVIEDIELRMCLAEFDTDVPLELIELYIF